MVKAIRAERPEALLLDGGDTWQGSLTALRTQGRDVVRAMNALGVEAMTSHWEFTLGLDRLTEIVENEIAFPFLGANIFDTEWDERAFEPYSFFERGGVKIAVMGCIVNGPGEMADADFGYVGSGPGRVSLYVGKEVLRWSRGDALNVPKIPCLPSSMPKPAAAEKLPRSMTPLDT